MEGRLARYQDKNIKLLFIFTNIVKLGLVGCVGPPGLILSNIYQENSFNQKKIPVE